MEFKAEPETFKEGLRTRSSGKPREDSIPRRRTELLVYRIRSCTGRLGFAIMMCLVSSAGAGQRNRGSRSPGAETGEWRGNGESQGRPLSSSLTLKEEREGATLAGGFYLQGGRDERTLCSRCLVVHWNT